MFSGKEEALEHRDAVFETFTEGFGTDQVVQISPILDGAKVKVAELDPDAVQEAFEEAGFSTQIIGEGPDGDWFELKVLP